MSIKIKNNAMKVKHDGTFEDVGMIIGNSAGVIDAVRSEGTTQVAAVNSAGATQVSAITTKGAETLASIPEDYTELSDEVSGLKET